MKNRVKLLLLGCGEAGKVFIVAEGGQEEDEEQGQDTTGLLGCGEAGKVFVATKNYHFFTSM